MAQANQKFHIRVQASVNGVSWTAIACDVIEARRVVVKNPDLVQGLLISTDTSDPAAQETIAAGAEYEIEFSSKKRQGFVTGETMFFLKGAGSSPIVRFQV